MSTNTKLAEALRRCEACTTNDAVGRQARDALASYDAEQAWESDPTSDAFKAGMAAMEYAIWDGKEPCPCRKQAAKAVPAGWKLVPVEPTPEMLKAADLEHASRGLVSIALISYRAMLAAAPAQQPAGQEQDERAAFDLWFSGFRHGWKSEKDVASDAWRAALAQRREPLTDAEIEEILHGEIALNPGDGCAGRFARAIERAHGIGGEGKA